MISPSPLDDVEFLARSAHRVEVLHRLAAGQRTRADLHEETGISQPTLGRVLGSLQDREWVERDGNEYTLTAFGELVVEKFDDLLSTVENVQRLRDLAGLLPTDDMDVDLRALAGATVTTPDAADPFRHVRRVEDLVYDADDLRLLSVTVAPGTIEDHAEQAVDFFEGDQRVQSVISADTLEQALNDPHGVEIFRRFVELERVDVYRYDGVIPWMVGLADGTAFLVPTDGQDLPRALVETDDERVIAWVDATIDDYVARSTPLTIETLPG